MTPIQWLDHTADAGFRASGGTIESAFCEAARALFSIMFAVDTIQPIVRSDIDITAQTLPGLLVEWLSELLAQKELTGTVFSLFELSIAGNGGSGFRARGVAFGEPLDRHRHQPSSEVKGISFLGLDVGWQDGAWNVQVIVDV